MVNPINFELSVQYLATDLRNRESRYPYTADQRQQARLLGAQLKHHGPALRQAFTPSPDTQPLLERIYGKVDAAEAAGRNPALSDGKRGNRRRAAAQLLAVQVTVETDSFIHARVGEWVDGLAPAEDTRKPGVYQVLRSLTNRPDLCLHRHDLTEAEDIMRAWQTQGEMAAQKTLPLL